MSEEDLEFLAVNAYMEKVEAGWTAKEIADDLKSDPYFEGLFEHAESQDDREGAEDELAEDADYIYDYCKLHLGPNAKIASARFIAENENGEVLGEADTYQEALTLGGTTVVDTENALESSFGGVRFEKGLVQDIMSGKIEESAAVEKIASKRGCNIGYAKKLLASWIEEHKPELLKSGVEDVSEDLEREFDVDGDLWSWFDDYVPEEGAASTKGGEILRATMRIMERWADGGEKIGRGYGNKSLNPAARYIAENVDAAFVEDMEKMLAHEFVPTNEEYEKWMDDFEAGVEGFLRNNEEVFHEANFGNYEDWQEDADYDISLGECFVEDDAGNKYWFKKEGRDEEDAWVCARIEFNGSPKYEIGDKIEEGVSEEEEWGTYEEGGFLYDWEAVGESDENGLFHEWRVADVRIDNQLCEKDEFADPLELGAVYDADGNEISEQEFIASAFIKSIFYLEKGKFGIQVNKGFGGNDDWILLDKNGKPNDLEPVEFRSRDEAQRSELFKNAKINYADARVVSYKDVNR